MIIIYITLNTLHIKMIRQLCTNRTQSGLSAQPPREIIATHSFHYNHETSTLC